MKKQLIKVIGDVLSCTKDEAEYYADQHINRLKLNNPRLNETQAIHSLLNVLS